MKKALIALLVVTLILGGLGIWYFLVREDELTVSAKDVDTEQNTQDISEQTSPDGDWKVQQQDDVFVGYEILELFAASSVKQPAIGRSPGVEGTFSVAGNVISDGSITVDMTQLESDSSSRDGKMKNEGLETDTFPEATFEQSAPVTFDGEFVKDEEISLSLPGTLTLHGVEKEVSIDITALWNGKVITVSGDVDITLSDFDIEPPNNSFVAVDETGTIKLQLLFIPQD
jgi:polyisoprenoid-binding protein YceI